MKRKTILLYLLPVLALIACEDVVDIDLDEGPPQLVVDAWLTDIDTTQSVRLSLTSSYFDNESDTSIDDASVSLKYESGETVELVYTDSGVYSVHQDSLEFAVGQVYTLNIEWQGNVYESVSEMLRVATVDSITYSKENLIFGGDDDPDSLWVAQFWGNDLPGVGDCYWPRSYKNDTLLDNNITLAYDAGTAPGARTDDVPFILPVRFGINPDGERYEFYQEWDTIRVDLYSISQDAFDFWNILRGQLNNGGLFATPPVNIPTNIQKVSGDGPDPLGWFSVSSVSSITRVLDPAQASESIF